MTTLIRHRFSVRRLPGPFRFPDIAPPEPGQILLLTGSSGSGKSTLLRRIVARIPAPQRLQLSECPLPNRPAVEIFDGMNLEDRLRLLSRVGLAEVYSWLRTPRQLSDGQRYRLRLALALARQFRSQDSGLGTLIADEFAAQLDTLTALIVSQALRKTVSTNVGLSAIVVTGRHELISAIRPDRLMHCDYGTVQEAARMNVET